MSDFSVSYLLKIINAILIFVLLLFVYTYITSLEAKGCECSSYPNSKFIKSFTIFAIIYLLFTAFIPDEMISNNFGVSILMFKAFIDLIFFIVFIYYLYVVFQYTRFLVNEKCKCSVDIRREIIMIGSLIEFALIFILFLVHFIFAVIYSAVFTAIREINNTSDNIRNVVRDPIGSLSKVPKSIKKDIGDISSYVKNTKKELSKIATKGIKSNSKVSKKK